MQYNTQLFIFQILLFLNDDLKYLKHFYTYLPIKKKILIFTYKYFRVIFFLTKKYFIFLSQNYDRYLIILLKLYFSDTIIIIMNKAKVTWDLHSDTPYAQ